METRKLGASLWNKYVLSVVVIASVLGFVFSIREVSAMPPPPEDPVEDATFVVEGPLLSVSCGEPYDSSGCSETGLPYDDPSMTKDCTAQMTVEHIIKGGYSIGDTVTFDYHFTSHKGDQCIVPGPSSFEVKVGDIVRIYDTSISYYELEVCGELEGYGSCGDGVCGPAFSLESHCTCPTDCPPDYNDPEPEPEPEPKTGNGEDIPEDQEEEAGTEAGESRLGQPCSDTGSVLAPESLFCNIDKTWEEMKGMDESCTKDYECLSALCEDGQCKESGNADSVSDEGNLTLVIVCVALSGLLLGSLLVGVGSVYIFAKRRKGEINKIE